MVSAKTIGLPLKWFQFAGGEIQAEIEYPAAPPYPPAIVANRVQSPGDLIALMMASEVLDRTHPLRPWKKLIIPYFPYARQDRVTKPNVAFSLKVMAQLVNSMGFEQVITCDIHSDVTPALVNNMRAISQFDLVTKHNPGLDEFIRRDVSHIVSPDAGAVKKATTIAGHYKLPLVIGMKVRDIATGEISGTRVLGDVYGARVLIVDDICDGGRTFIELAKALREAGAAKVYLYVTHGIFSKGFSVFEGLIDRIYTTDTFIPAVPLDQSVFVNPLPYLELLS